MHPQGVRLYLCGGGEPYGLVPQHADGTYERPDTGDYQGPVTDYIEITVGDGGVYVCSGAGGISVEPKANNRIHVSWREF